MKHFKLSLLLPLGICSNYCVVPPLPAKPKNVIDPAQSPLNLDKVSLPIDEKKNKLWRIGTLVYTAAGLSALFLWLLMGDFTIYLKDRGISNVASIMLRSFKAEDWFVGLLVSSVPAGLGLIIVPMFSVISDRYRSRWGRRLPFIFVSTPVMALSLIGLAFTPYIGTQLSHLFGLQPSGEIICHLSVFTLFWSSFSIASTIITALFIALVNDVVPDNIAGRFFGVVRAASFVAGILFNFYLLGLAKTHSFEILIGLGLAVGFGLTVMCLMVKEGAYDEPPPKPKNVAQKRLFAPVIAYVSECFREPFYRWFFVAWTLGLMALSPVNTFPVFHARSLGMDDDFYGKCMALSFTIALFMSYPIGILADRFHPVRLGIAGMAIYATVTLYGFFFARNAWTFAIALVLHTVFATFYLTATQSVMQRLLPKAKFGQFASAAGLISSFCIMTLSPFLGVFIQAMNHNYNYVFLLASLLAVASAGAYAMVLQKFKSLGGDENYSPP